MNIKLVSTLLILGSTQALAQVIDTNQINKEYCPYRRLSYMHPKDSTRRRVVLDSVNKLLVSQWQLIDIGTKTFNVMPTPEDSIEMSIGERGNAIVRSKGKQVVEFQLAAGINFNNLRCVISEAGRAYFHLRASRKSKGEEEVSQQEVTYPNGLRVCEDYLMIYAFTSAGPSYIFKRLVPIQLESKQRN